MREYKVIKATTYIPHSPGKGTLEDQLNEAAAEGYFALEWKVSEKVGYFPLSAYGGHKQKTKYTEFFVLMMRYKDAT